MGCVVGWFQGSGCSNGCDGGGVSCAPPFCLSLHPSLASSFHVSNLSLPSPCRSAAAPKAPHPEPFSPFATAGSGRATQPHEASGIIHHS